MTETALIGIGENRIDYFRNLEGGAVDSPITPHMAKNKK
jgi:hypothetical protein